MDIPQYIDKYQIIEELGRGEMGCVYKTFHPQMNKFIALKVIYANNKNLKEKKQRFAREAKAMAKMNHPNIVKIYDIGENNGNPFFTMDYIDGLSLKTFLQNTPLNVRLFSQLIIKIGSAITYAHQQGIIHRDLKPANIMLSKNMQPYVLDFGMARLTKAEENLTKKGAILGTPQYMSPEQASGKKVNHLTDVYALGAIFYEMLAKEPLVKGQSSTDVIFNIVHKEPASLRQVNAKLSKNLEIICHKAVAKEREKRYQSAEEFTEDIKRFLNGEVIHSATFSTWKRAWKKVYSNKWAMLTGIVGIFLITVAIWSFEKQENPEVHLYLAKAKKWHQKALKQKIAAKQMQMNIKASTFFEKALELAPKNFSIKQELIKVQEKMGILAREQKNYLLSFAIFNKCKRLGYKKANILLNELEYTRKQLEKKHRRFIIQAMEKITLPQKFIDRHIDRYVFAIVKMQRPYVVAMLAPYLESLDKEQRILAIKALGRFGNTHTKFKGLDSVTLLLNKLVNFKDKSSIENNQQEIEEIIWALGWLKDHRANIPVYGLRKMAGDNSALWIKTQIPYKWIPIQGKTLANNAKQLIFRGRMEKEKGHYREAIVYYTKAIAFNPNSFISSLAYNDRGVAYNYIKEYRKAVIDYTKAIALYPKNSNAYNNRGSAYWQTKDYHRAIADFTKAIAIAPKISSGYNNRGLAYLKIKEYHKAIADFTKVIHLNPKYFQVYNNRGLAYYDIKKYRKAIADYTKTIMFIPKDAMAYVNRGNAYGAIKEYPKAIADFTRAINLNPKSTEVYTNRGNVYNTIKEYPKAIADYNKAILVDSKNATAYANRGNVYLKTKKYPKAMADYNKAIALSPKYSKAYSNRGLVHKELKKYSKAMLDYSKAIALDPKNSNAYSNRGYLYYQAKKYSKAIADYTQVIALDPKNSNVYNNRGMAYSDIREYRKALSDYTIAINLFPEFFDAYNNRGMVYSDLRAHRNAIADFTAAIRYGPTHPQAYNNRAQTYHDIREYKKAFADYNKAIAVDAKFANAYQGKGDLYQALKKYHLAIENYNKAIACNPNYAMAYNNRAGVYAKRGEYNKAIVDFSKAIALNPKLSIAYNNRGLSYYYIKHYKKAIASYTQAIDVAPSYTEAYNNRGSVYFGLKEYNKAIADYSKAITLNPKNSSAYGNRGNVYFNIKKYHKAIADYNKAIALNPKNVAAYNNRANACNRVGKYHQSIKDYSKAIYFNPKFSLAYGNRGSVYLHLKQYQKAYSDFQTFLKLVPNHPIAPKIRAMAKDLRQKIKKQ